MTSCEECWKKADGTATQINQSIGRGFLLTWHSIMGKLIEQMAFSSLSMPTFESLDWKDGAKLPSLEPNAAPKPLLGALT